MSGWVVHMTGTVWCYVRRHMLVLQQGFCKTCARCVLVVLFEKA